MNLPPEPSNERRAVPRHIRDGEHRDLEDTLAEKVEMPRRRPGLWILLALAAVAVGAWIALHGGAGSVH
jgi:hypothetical protein